MKFKESILFFMIFIIATACNSSKISDNGINSNFWIYCIPKNSIYAKNNLADRNGLKLYFGLLEEKIFIFNQKVRSVDVYYQSDHHPEIGSPNSFVNLFISKGIEVITAGRRLRDVPFGEMKKRVSLELQLNDLSMKYGSYGNAIQDYVCKKSVEEQIERDGLLDVKIRGTLSSWEDSGRYRSNEVEGDPNIQFDNEGRIRYCQADELLEYGNNGKPKYPLRLGEFGREVQINGKWVSANPKGCTD